MSFFNDITTDGTFEAAPSIDVIPHDTTCVAMIDDCGRTEYQGDEYINLRWTVLEPSIYKNRKIFQKVKVHDIDAKKREKALRMLAAIDANCGGKLLAANEEPTDTMLAKALLNKPMLIKVMVWEMDDRKGNWISAVSPRSKQQAPAAKKEPEYDADIEF